MENIKLIHCPLCGAPSLEPTKFKPFGLTDTGGAGDYSFDKTENGYVIYDKEGKIIEPWEIVKLLSGKSYNTEYKQVYED